MKKYFSQKVTNLPKEPGMFEIYNIANEKERKGDKVIHMEIGRPDFDTPKPIKDSAVSALNGGLVHYTELSGIYDLRKSIADRVKESGGLEYNPENEVLVTAGASEGLYCIWIAFLDNKDEILIPTPHYSSYTYSLTYAGAKYIKVPIMKNNKIKYDMQEFKSRLTENTKMILINSPNNPTGYVNSQEDMENIAEFAIENDLIVVSDECYDCFVYEGEHKSISTLPGMRDRTLIVNSTSKTFSMTGWRIGYVLGNADFIDKIGNIHSHINVCSTSFAQAGAITAYKDIYKDIDIMVNEFKRRRDYITDFISKLDNITFVDPKGAFYIFMNIGELGLTSVDFCKSLLRETGVAMAPGSAFGVEWEDYVRISYACSMDDIKKAMNLMKSFIEKIR